jgi:hypothetical protein
MLENELIVSCLEIGRYDEIGITISQSGSSGKL